MDEQPADEWLFEVEEVFDLSGGFGLVIVCDLEPSGAILRVGEALVFLCADGQEIETQIEQFPMISRSLRHPRRNLTTIGLPTTKWTKQIAPGDQAFRRVPSG